MSRRRVVKDDRQEPQFGYMRRVDPSFDEARAKSTARASRPRRKEWSLLPVFLVGAVIILFCGFLWISYTKGPKLTPGQLPIITADTTPIKVKPEKPGGEEIPFQDTTVYDDLNQGKQKHPAPQVEHLLAPPEQPMDLPANSANPAATNAVPVAPTIASTPTATPSQEDSSAAITTDTETALAPQEPAANKLLPPPPAATALPAKPAPVTAKPIAFSPTGTSSVQLGSFKDEAAAKTEWQRLKNRYSDQLSALDPSFVRVDLAEKGIWYRLRAGSVSADQAKSICAVLTQAKAPCLVAETKR